MKNSLLVAAFMILALGRLYGQTTRPAEKLIPPPGPLIESRAPEYSRWTIYGKTMSKGGESGDKTAGTTQKDASPNGSPKFTITKTGKIIRVIFFEDAKLPWNIWCMDSTVIAVWPDGKNVGLAARPNRPDAFNPLYMDFSKSDFQGFEWISEKNFAGVQDVLGRKCLVFRDNVKRVPEGTRSDDPEAASASFESAAVASVDLETRLPVSLVNENGAFVYQFHEAPSAMQTLPPNVQAVIDQQKEAAQAVARRPSRPF